MYYEEGEVNDEARRWVTDILKNSVEVWCRLESRKVISAAKIVA